MTRRQLKKQWLTSKKIIVAILLGTAGWAIYNFLTRNAAELLSSQGLVDMNLQDIAIILSCITIAAILTGKGWLESAKGAP
jgi:hypothetical protein